METYTSPKDLASLVADNPTLLIPDRPIAFNREYVSLGIGVAGALMLSQVVYWSKNKKTQEREGWFFKTVKEWEEETGLTVNEQRLAKNKLLGIKVIKIEKRGVPAKNWFKLDINALFKALASQKMAYRSVPLIPQHKQRGIHSTGDVESTALLHTEITTETTYIDSLSSNENSLQDKKDKKRHTDKREKTGHPLSVKRTSGDVRTTEGPPERAAVGVNDIMSIFHKINPTLNWGNKTSRRAAEDLIKRFGPEEAKRMAEMVVAAQGQPYAPVATNPYQFREKLAQFKLYFQRNNYSRVVEI